MSVTPVRTLRAGGATIELGPVPVLMGVVEVSSAGSLDADLQSAAQAVAAGARIVEVAARRESATRPPSPGAQPLERLVALIERVANELDAIAAVRTNQRELARLAVKAGARIVNDPSALLDPTLVEMCAESGAALVINALSPGGSRGGDERAVEETVALLEERLELAGAQGMEPERLIVGVGFGPDGASDVRGELLRNLARLHDLSSPLLLEIAEPDTTAECAGDRQAASTGRELAALAHGVEQGAQIFAVRDVAGAADFLTVRAALAGELELRRDLALGEEVRYERQPGS